MKTCTKCGETKPLDQYPKHSTCKGGRAPVCRECKLIKKRAYYCANAAALKAKATEYQRNNRERTNAIARKHLANNRENINARARERNATDSAKTKAKQYRQDRSAHYAALAAAQRAKDPEAHRAQQREWARQNPDKTQARTAAYRAARLNATPAWFEKSAIEWLYLDSATRAEAHHVDHVLPLQGETVCGLHCLANLEIVTASENTSKQNRFDQDAESVMQLEVTRAAMAR